MRILSFLAAVLASTSFHAAVAQDLPPSDAPGLASLVTRQGPLAVSGDGRWRVHVDAKNVLHRVATTDHVESGHLALPLMVRTLAIARGGERAALLSSGGCLGIVDFMPTTSLHWVALDGGNVRWSDAPPAACASADDTESPNAHFGLLVLALSDDGRLAATRVAVIDLEARRVVARMPQTSSGATAPAALPTELHFVDGGKKLLALLAGVRPPRDHYDDYHAVLLQAAVWDLETRHLLHLADIPTIADGGTGVAASIDLTTGFVWSVGHDPRVEGGGVLLRTPLSDCEARPQRVAAVDANIHQWIGDPRQRWLGRVTWNGADPDGRQTTPLLEVHVDSIVGAPLLHIESDRDVKFVASPDGSTLYGLRMPPASKAWPPVKAYGGDAVEWRIPGLASSAAVPPAAWGTHACADPTEAEGARLVVLQARPIPAAWERRMSTLETLREHLDPAARSGGHCSERLPGGVRAAAFVRTDGGLWLDAFDHYEQIDPATGHALASEPTVRRPGVCARPVPAADGSVAWAGDTLSLRSFGTGVRKAIDVRPGWKVELVALDAGQVRVRWTPKAGTPAAAGSAAEGGGSPPFHDVVYDMHGWRAITDVVDQDDPNSDAPDSAYAYYDEAPGLCKAPDGRKRDGWDVEVALNDAFESVRGVACVPSLPDGVGPTAMRLGLDLEAGDSAPDALVRTAAGSGGAIVVVQEGRTLRVFDVQRRKELGRIALAGEDLPPRVHVLADRGWIIVDTLVADGPATEHLVRGYAIPH